MSLPGDEDFILGQPDEIAEARRKLEAVQESNAYAAVQIIAAISKRISVESATLSVVREAAPHLFTRFLMKEALSSLTQANRLLTAALELLPIDAGEMTEGGIVLPEPPSSSEPDQEQGTGQYL